MHIFTFCGMGTGNDIVLFQCMRKKNNKKQQHQCHKNESEEDKIPAKYNENTTTIITSEQREKHKQKILNSWK